jgi:hypothetical protein
LTGDAKKWFMNKYESLGFKNQAKIPNTSDSNEEDEDP